MFRPPPAAAAAEWNYARRRNPTHMAASLQQISASLGTEHNKERRDRGSPGAESETLHK
ncbi:hypothetical protein E3U43_001850 [Larimichthys crocea]|uniref:Uncharacterized protein n=1 Tax=Larimichthys crocea TaxID=215358 RepID=A0ACD3RDZ0_LARCR|nr:hypothetical protein E3U43_001850 [Larimichthys crocea]